VEKGIQGTVAAVDDVGTLHMNWDNGRSLGLIYGEDQFKVLSRPQEEAEEKIEQEKDQSQGMGGMNL